MDNPNLKPKDDSIPMQDQVIIVETLPLDKKLELAKKINWQDIYEQGKFLDAMDSVSQWCLAECTLIEQRNVSIHFDGWSSKWDFVILYSLPILYSIYFNSSFWHVS